MNKPNKLLVFRKVLPEFIRACYKESPDILALQVQTVQPERVGVNSAFLWDVIVSNEQFFSFVCTVELGTPEHETKPLTKQCIHRLKCILLNLIELDCYIADGYCACVNRRML